MNGDLQPRHNKKADLRPAIAMTFEGGSREGLHVLQSQLIGLAEHTVHEETKDTEDGIVAHV